MDHPHSAVLLLCNSHEKGCRSYICDTSYKHSNCLDRFKKLRVNPRSPTLSRDLPRIPDQSNGTSDTITLVPQDSVVQQNDNSEPVEDRNASVVGDQTEGLAPLLEGQGGDHRENSREDNHVEDIGFTEIVNTDSLHGRVDVEGTVTEDTSESKLSLKCRLCRGDVLGWEVSEDARRQLNLKKHSCSRESCSYHGNYQEMCRRARRVHPTTRPSHVDPSREQAWRRLEHQKEYADIVIAIRSAIPGAVVVGDYIIENGDRFTRGRGNGAWEVGHGQWWTTFFLFHIIGAMEANGDSRPRSRSWARNRCPPGSDRRVLWGENLLGLQDDDDPDDDDDNSDDVQILRDGEDASFDPRRRRMHLTRLRSDEDQL